LECRVLYISALYQHKVDIPDGCFITQQIALLSKTNRTRVISPVPILPHKNDILSPNKFIKRISGISHNYEHNNTRVYAPKFFRLPKKPFYFTEGKFFLRAVAKQFDKIPEFQPEIVHSYWLYPDCWAASQIAKKLKVPHIVSISGTDIYFLDKPGISSQALDVIKGASAIIIQNSRELEKLKTLQINVDRIHTLSNGVDISRFFMIKSSSECKEITDNYGMKKENFNILYVGHLFEVKRVDVLIKAFKIFNRKHPKSSLYIIGKGRLKTELESQAASLLPPDTYKFINEIPQTSLPNWYNTASTLVLPSVSEGIPNVIMEALSCGTPVIGSDIPGTRDIIEPGSGLLFEPKNHHELANRLVSASQTNWNNRAISENAHKKFDKKDRIAKINAIYANLVRG